MPLYEYQCTGCNHEFELRQKFSDEPPSACPSCGGAVQKKISSASFSLKGNGWFSEGYCPKSPTGEKPAACASGGG